MQKHIIEPIVQTVSNYWINFLHLEDNHYSMFDIAHGLSNLCRYTGHTDVFYSVGQHSYLGTQFMAKDRKMAFLLHDGHEAYMGDIITPFKHATPAIRAAIKQIEDPLQADLFKKLGIDLEPYGPVKVTDLNMLRWEMSTFMPEHLTSDYPPIIADPPVRTRVEFLKTYFMLGGVFVEDDWHRYCKYVGRIAQPIQDMLDDVL